MSPTSSSDGMPLGDETSRRVDDPLSSIGVVSSVDNVSSLAQWAQSDGLVGDQLVGSEAIVQLDDLNILGRQPGFGVELLGDLLDHIETNHLDVGLLLEDGGEIRTKLEA